MKIAIARRNGLGDLLCTYPLITYLKRSSPDVEITLFVDARNAPLLPYLPPVDEVVIFPAKGNKYWNLFRIALRYRSHHFSQALSAKTSPMKLMNLFLFALGAKKRTAVVDHKWHRLFINDPHTFNEKNSKKKHQALKGLQLVAPHLTEIPPSLFPKLTIPREKKEAYAPQLEPLFGEEKLPRVLLSASTTRPSSRFDPKRYAECINRVHAQKPLQVCLIGQPSDRSRAEAITSHLTMKHALHYPRNFDEFMVLLNLCDLYFVSDGGIAHIGAALGKQTVVLFGESNPVEWSPLGEGVETFYDPRHVDRLSDEKIIEALCAKVAYGRENHDSRLGSDSHQPLSA